MSQSPTGLRPLLLGHRGARIRGISENTIPAFDFALQQGCDGFEFDVRCTRDDRLIICHDPEFLGKNLSRSNFREVPGSPPNLEDVLARYSGTAFLDIEVKVVGMQRAVLAALREHPPKRGYVVSSFLPEALFEIRDQDARVPLGFICDKKNEFSRWPTLPVEYVIPHYKLLSRAVVDELHTAGKKVFMWTVNDKGDMKRFAEWGVEAIISDDPQALAGTLASNQNR